MTTYNTGNPLGSTSPKDLYDNAENLDSAVNSTADTWTDRLGVERPTLPKLISDYPNAGADADRAEEARDIAIEQADISTEQAGIATAQAVIATEQRELSETGRVGSEAAQSGAEAARDAALLSRGVFASTADALSKGVASLASLVAGSGGTNGTFDLAFSGGAGTGAAGVFVVAGGAVVSTTITATGRGYTSAPTVSFAASSGLTGASATAVIANNADVGEYFSVPVVGTVDSLILYRVDAGPVATELTRYPSADSVQKPVWAGKFNGWADTFFRHSAINVDFMGRKRWYDSGNPASAASMALVANPVFSGNAVRKTGNVNLFGPRIHIDEIGATTGDVVTIRMLVTAGAVGGNATIYARAYNEAGTVATGTQIAGNTVTTSSTPQLMTVSVTIPSGTGFLWLYPIANNGTADFDIVALWAFKGAASTGPVWPMYADSYFEFRDTEIEGRLDAVEANVADYVAFESVLGAPEMVGDSTYTTGVAGAYEQVTTAKSVNTIEYRVWATSGSTNVEWKLWLRDTAGGFNMNSVSPNVSGTILAGDFPTSDSLFTLRLASKLAVAAGKYLFIMFKASDGTSINIKRWLYNAGVVPARHGFPFAVSSDWNNSISLGGPTIGFGQTAPRFLCESDEGRVISSRVDAIEGEVADLSALVASVTGPVEMVMPPFIFGVQGREANVYFDNLHLGDADDYRHDVTSASTTGKQQNERWTWTPSGALASGTVTIAAHDKRSGTLLTTKTAQQRAAASSAGTGLNKKVLVIGDSLIGAGVITQTVLDIAGSDVMAATMLGTQGTAPNKHEGRGGWSVGTYTSAGPTYYDFTVSGVTVEPAINAAEYTHNGSTYRVQVVNLTAGAGTLRCSVVSGGAPLTSGTLTKSNGAAGDATIAFSATATAPGNPFWIGGAVNFPQYLTDNSLATPDWVFIHLGINDVFGQTSDSAASSFADSAFTQLDTLITSIKAAGAGIKVGLMIPTPPSADQDSFGANYDTGQTRWRFKRNILIWARQLIAKYAGQEASRIYIVPSNTALDTVNNMSRAASAPVNSRSAVTGQRQSNGVHPATSGYQQIGDALWAFLKFYA